MARLGDGWMNLSRNLAEAKPALDLLDRYLEEAGRSRTDFGIEPRISYEEGDPKAWEKAMREWQAEGATHISFNTMGSEFTTPQEHLQAIQKFAKVALTR
jgi:alkanesulfonate monooxygenase SsuD/methylene tetrahydromethanopterin reductase-like flavin-dependent oxidoreductase (luciferase family)